MCIMHMHHFLAPMRKWRTKICLTLASTDYQELRCRKTVSLDQPMRNSLTKSEPIRSHVEKSLSSYWCAGSGLSCAAEYSGRRCWCAPHGSSSSSETSSFFLLFLSGIMESITPNQIFFLPPR